MANVNQLIYNNAKRPSTSDNKNSALTNILSAIAKPTINNANLVSQFVKPATVAQGINVTPDYSKPQTNYTTTDIANMKSIKYSPNGLGAIANTTPAINMPRTQADLIENTRNYIDYSRNNPTNADALGSNANSAADGSSVGGSGAGSGGGYSAAAQNQALLDAYNQRADMLQQNYNAALGMLQSNYDFNADAINRAADNALREAYINRMMNERNLNQRMNMQGLTGGAAESTISGLLNNYGNQRNNIETQRINNIADLLNTYQNNLATTAQRYNENLLDAMPTYSQMLYTPKTTSSSSKSTSSTVKEVPTDNSAIEYARQQAAAGKTRQQIGIELMQEYGIDGASKIILEAGI